MVTKLHDEKTGLFVVPHDWEQDRQPGLPPVTLQQWDPAWETDKKKYLRFIQRLSDQGLARRRCLYGEGNPNRPESYGTLDGLLEADLYATASKTYGEEGFVVQRDYAFLYPTEQALLGPLAGAPFNFTVRNLDKASTRERLWAQAEMGADMIMKQVLEGIQQQTGMDQSHLMPTRPLPQNADELLAELSAPEQLEMLVTAGVQEVDARYSFSGVGLAAARHLMAVNAEFFLVEDMGDTVRPVALHPDQVSWLSARRITDLEEAEAVFVHDYLSLSELVALYGAELDTAPGYEGLREFLLGVARSSQPLLSYYADTLYLGRDYQEAGGPQPGDSDERPLAGIDWITSDAGTPAFYFAGEGAPAVLRQRCWYRLIRPRRYKVTVGSRNPTDDDKRWIRETWRRDARPEEVRYAPVDDDYAPGDGEWVVQGGAVEWHHFTRIGHSVLLRAGRDHRCPDITSQEPDVRGYPVVGAISYQRSIVTLSGFFAYVWNVAFNRVADLVVSTGMSTALVIDPDQLPDWLDYETANYMARKLGVVVTQPQRKQGEPKMGENKHLSTIQFNPSENDISRILVMIAAFQRVWSGLVGIPLQALEGLPAGGFNLGANGALTRLFYHRHNQAMQDLVRRVADRGRHAWAGGEWRAFDVGRGRTQVLKQSRKLTLARFGLYLEATDKSVREKEMVVSWMPQLLSGSITEELWEKLYTYMVSDNPAEGRAIFRTAMSEIDKAKLAEGEARQQAAQQMAEAARRKAESPERVATINQQTAFGVADRRNQSKIEALNAKGDMEDIKAARQGLAGVDPAARQAMASEPLTD